MEIQRRSDVWKMYPKVTPIEKSREKVVQPKEDDKFLSRLCCDFQKLDILV